MLQELKNNADDFFRNAWFNSEKSKSQALYKLLGTEEFSQSKKIQCGKKIEQFCLNLVRHSKKVKLLDIEYIQCLNKLRQIDILFQDLESKKLYYFEIKTNTAMDAEKKDEVFRKCKDIKDALQIKYNIMSNSIYYGILDFCSLDGEIKSEISQVNDCEILYFPLNEFLFYIGLNRLNKNEFYDLLKYIGNIFKSLPTKN